MNKSALGTLTVRGHERTVAMPRTIPSSLRGRSNNAEPAPLNQYSDECKSLKSESKLYYLLTTKSIGQPQFRSTKSTEMVSSKSWAHLVRWSGWGPQIFRYSAILLKIVEENEQRWYTWTPNMSSDGWRRNNAHSEVWPWMIFSARAISPHVISAPMFLQILGWQS